MIERSLQLDGNSMNTNGGRCATRPTDLPTENRRWVRHRKFVLKLTVLNCKEFIKSVQFVAQSFPTPMEEPKKILKAQYLGATEVQQPTGMEILNTAIETALRDSNAEQWENVNVAVAPSMISIHSSDVSVAYLNVANQYSLKCNKFVYINYI